MSGCGQRTDAAESPAAPVPGELPVLPRGLRVGFLFNHDSHHQVAHCAPYISELTRLRPELDVTVLASSESQLEHVRRFVQAPLAPGLTFQVLGVPPLVDRVDRVFRHLGPLRRLAVLRWNLDAFRRLDVLVAPETFCLALRTRFGLKDLRIVYTHHGAGDRSAGFTPEIAGIDFVLVPGRKIRDRLLSAGLLREGRYAVVGYPKFDALGGTNGRRPRHFQNDKPVVLYNPHFEPRLSSWYAMGDAVLDFFAGSPRYNLVFAPHVMLFQRRLHTTPENFGFRIRRKLARRHRGRGNIHIDLGGEACVDMTYTRGAHLYLGDVSSQVYEFLLEPRPCVFLNAHGARWRGDPSYRHWGAGPVLDEIGQLEAALERAWEDHGRYRAVQEELLAETFDRTGVPSTRRGAEAIAGYLATVR